MNTDINQNDFVPSRQEQEILQILEKEKEPLTAEVFESQSESEDSVKTVVQGKLNDALNLLKVYSPHIANIFKNLKGEEIICVTADTIKKMKEVGADFLPNSAKNAFSPMLRKAGKIVGHADLEKKILPNSNLVPALAMSALAQQIAALQRQLEDIQESLNIVLQGQWNDRFAKIDAAKNELFLALHTKDVILRQHLLANALNLSCQGEFEISRSMKNEMECINKLGYLTPGVKKKTKERVENLMNHIPYLFDSWNVKMVLLQECNEYEAIKNEASRIHMEMSKIFNEKNIESLRSRTHKGIGKNKIGKAYWEKELPEKLNKNANLLSKIFEQSDFLLNLQEPTTILEEA
ncbi:hypothetical protein [uncultured Fibrobacter sp.]|jgi:hypothetical protein|uniref:hypothetical protein n=1 Tax=uncultured Fibrobacter sp. TaxID=261512 RepID=UPI0025FF15CC|nr:hypothetical protein [uncultured Fibrobacter sp.]